MKSSDTARGIAAGANHADRKLGYGPACTLPQHVELAVDIFEGEVASWHGLSRKGVVAKGLHTSWAGLTLRRSRRQVASTSVLGTWPRTPIGAF